MLELRRDAEAIIEQVRKGQRILLTYRGKPVMRLEPIESEAVTSDDPFYKLSELADADAAGLNNTEIDQILYGK